MGKKKTAYKLKLLNPNWSSNWRKIKKEIYTAMTSVNNQPYFPLFCNPCLTLLYVTRSKSDGRINTWGTSLATVIQHKPSLLIGASLNKGSETMFLCLLKIQFNLWSKARVPKQKHLTKNLTCLLFFTFFLTIAPNLSPFTETSRWNCIWAVKNGELWLITCTTSILTLACLEMV